MSAAAKADREKAQRELEALGAAAIDPVQRALSGRPGGELEERLTDIARVVGANEVNKFGQTSIKSSTEDLEQMRTRRMIQLLDWSDDPSAAAQSARLTAKRLAASSRPSR